MEHGGDGGEDHRRGRDHVLLPMVLPHGVDPKPHPFRQLRLLQLVPGGVRQRWELLSEVRLACKTRWYLARNTEKTQNTNAEATHTRNRHKEHK